MTTGHIRLLARYTKNFVLLFDGDNAGISAAERSMPNFMEIGMMPKIVILPDGKDPDDWIKEHSADEFKILLADADTLLAWHIRARADECGSNVQARFKLISDLQPVLNQLGSAVEFTFYRKLLADQLKMDESDLLRQFRYKGSVSVEKGGAPVTGTVKAEKLLLSLLLEYPNYICWVKEIIAPEHFSDASFRTVFELILKEQDLEKFSAGALIDHIGDEELKRAVHELSVFETVDEMSVEDALNDCIRNMTKFSLSQRLKVISDEIKKAEKVKDEDRILELVTEKNRLLLQNL